MHPYDVLSLRIIQLTNENQELQRRNTALEKQLNGWIDLTLKGEVAREKMFLGLLTGIARRAPNE